jgi:photosystem II stability/assembly factor-like uncharacterized protein
MTARGGSWVHGVMLLLMLLLTSASSSAQTEPSEAAALAAESLLLDIVRAGPRLVAVGERGHVLLSDDDGNSWRQVIVPTRSQLTAVHFPDPTHGWAVGHDSVIIHSRDAGESWQLQNHDPQYDDPLLDVWFRNQREGFAIGAYGMFLSTSNGGQSWDRRTIIDEDLHFNALTALADGELFIAAEQGNLLHSTDGGYSWEALPSPYAGSFFGITAIGADSLLVYGLRGRLYRSDDRGQSWTRLETATETSLMSAEQGNGDRIAVVGLGGTILTSEDGAMQFSQRVHPERMALTGVVVNPGGSLLLSGENGITTDDPKH